MSTTNTDVDKFNTNEDEVSMPYLHIQSNNLWFNPILDEYPDELKMFIQILHMPYLPHLLFQ